MNKADFIKHKLAGHLLAGALCLALTAPAQAQETRRPPVIEANAKKPWSPPPLFPQSTAPKVVKDLLPFVVHEYAGQGNTSTGPLMPNGIALPQPHGTNGGTLKFVMGSKPSKWAREGVPPPSLSDERKL